MSKILALIEAIPVPISHSLLALLQMGVVWYVFSNPVAGACFGIAWACSREVRDWQKGSGYGLWAWLLPTICCIIVATIVVVGGL